MRTPCVDTLEVPVPAQWCSRLRLRCCYCQGGWPVLQPTRTCGLTTRQGQLTRWITESVMLPIMAFFIALRPREAVYVVTATAQQNGTTVGIVWI
jgi:hypothetical protein